MKLSMQQLDAVVVLRRNRDFSVFVNAVATHCSTLNEKLLKLPQGDEYLRGQVFAYSALLEALNEASTNLERAKKPKT
jgi:hypothetical protein